MATAPILELDTQPTAGTDIVAVVTQNPGIVLLDREKYSVWYESLKAKGAAIPADVSSKKSRDALRSFAAEVRSEKAGIKKARLRLTEEWRSMTAQANAAGKEIDEQLETLATEVRKPLTEWEEAEERRVLQNRAIIDMLRSDGIVRPDDTAATVRERGIVLWHTELDPGRYGDMLDEAKTVKDQSIEALKAALTRLTQEEADRAELARLRQEQIEREAREARERDAAAAAAALATKERLAREEAERNRLAVEEEKRLREEREAQRIEQARKDAAEAAQREAEKAAQVERERVQREHDEALAAERAKAAEAERLRQAEADRIAEQERQREAQEAAARAEAKRIADEQAKRERNRAHRAQIMGEVKIAIMAAGGIDEDAAVKIVKAIVAGGVPHVSLEF